MRVRCGGVRVGGALFARAGCGALRRCALLGAGGGVGVGGVSERPLRGAGGAIGGALRAERGGLGGVAGLAVRRDGAGGVGVRLGGAGVGGGGAERGGGGGGVRHRLCLSLSAGRCAPRGKRKPRPAPRRNCRFCMAGLRLAHGGRRNTDTGRGPRGGCGGAANTSREATGRVADGVARCRATAIAAREARRRNGLGRPPRPTPLPRANSRGGRAARHRRASSHIIYTSRV